MAKDKQATKDIDEVVFYAYPKLIFVWPLVVFGFVFFFITPDIEPNLVNNAAAKADALANLELEPDPAIAPDAKAPDANPDAVKKADGAENAAAPAKNKIGQRYLEVLGWLYVLLFMLVVLTLGVDVERNYAVFWLVVFCFFYFLGRWLADAQGFTLFGNIYNWFADMDLKYSRQFGLVVSIFLAFPFFVMLFWSRLQHKWRITHNEFEHYSFGRADDSLARGAKRVRSTYPDLLELLLCGAGTLIVYSATGRSELRRIHHVPLLPVVRRKINKLLETYAVERDGVLEEEMESEGQEEEMGMGETDHESVGGGDGSGDIGGEKL